jgi:hypothetical protein
MREDPVYKTLEDLLSDLIRPFAETLSRHPPEGVKVRYKNGPTRDAHRNKIKPDDISAEMILKVDEGDLILRIMVRGDKLGYRIKTSGGMPLDEKTWPMSDPDCVSKVRKTLYQFMGYWYYGTIKSLESRIELTREQIKMFEEVTDEDQKLGRSQ